MGLWSQLNWPWPTQGSLWPSPATKTCTLSPVRSCANWVMLEERSCPCLIIGTPVSFYKLGNKTKVLSCSLLNGNSMLCH